MAVSQTTGSTGNESFARSRLSPLKNQPHDLSFDDSAINETTYLEENDPDYNIDETTASTTSDEEDDDYTSEVADMESTESLELDDDVANIKPAFNVFASPFFETGSTTNLLLDTHRRFRKFVHKYEIPRKGFHTSIGFITLYLYTLNVQEESIAKPLSIGLAVVFLFDLVRLNWKAFNGLYCKVVGVLMRESEVDSWNGVIWYLLGLTIVFATQPKDIAVMSTLLLSWSDTTASAIGRKFGHLTPKIARGKSLAGSLAAFMTGVVAAYIFYGYFVPYYPEVNVNSKFAWTPETSHLNLHTLAILCGFVAAVSEGIDLFNWDDNFTIPVLSSIFLNATFKLAAKA
ncbi:unnamed protein product [Ambrosiozyma monospora]|uniref:Unnamed protein product n=1 Tax=Ambrosiozyma monospora TaxID=43982 RepID=A0ACB5TDT0_AMBMO|nr:unnamed protein product [Ambrosiozyma monospora]